MKIIGHYPEEGDLREDPNLHSLLEHSGKLLSEEYQFESPFKDSMCPTSEVDPDDFDLNVEDIGLEDDFDLSERLSGFISKIREEDKGKCESGCDSFFLKVLVEVIAAIVPVLFFFLALRFEWFVTQDNTNSNASSGYNWLLILFGIILSLAYIATLIVCVYHIRKKDELDHEDSRLFVEHQNKMINEYASYLYSIKRVRIQQCETLLSLKQQYALQQMDFQQREMDMRLKEQDNAWKHLGDHQNAVREHLSNLHYEMNSNKKQTPNNDENNSDDNKISNKNKNNN